MGYGVHEVTEEFQDEDKWLFLTKRQWAIILPAVLIAVAVIMFVVSAVAMLLPLAIIAMVLLIMAAVSVAFFDLPSNWYLIGNRVKIEKVAFRYLKKKRKEKKLYTKHHDNGYREW